MLDVTNSFGSSIQHNVHIKFFFPCKFHPALISGYNKTDQELSKQTLEFFALQLSLQNAVNVCDSAVLT